MKYKFKEGDKLISKFDGRTHQITKVLKSKIYWSENPDGTGDKHSATPLIVAEIFNFDVEKDEIKTSATSEKKPLFLIMQKYWFDEILEGRKDVEYREDTPFYRSRLINKDGDFRNFSHVLMQVGYNADARRMTIEIKKIVLDGYFEIHLGEITDRNF